MAVSLDRAPLRRHRSFGVKSRWGLQLMGSKVTRTLFPPHSERSGNAFWPPAFGTFPERPERGPPGDLEARARSRRGTVCTSQMNNKLISAASSYAHLALAHPEKKDEPDDDHASEHQGCHAGAHQGFRKWGHHPQKGQRPPTARPFGTFRERVLRPVVRNGTLPLTT